MLKIKINGRAVVNADERPDVNGAAPDSSSFW